MAATKSTRTTKDASGRTIKVPVTTSNPMSEQLSADDGLTQLRKTYVARAREALRATVLPRLEVVISSTQITLLQALEDLSS
jgi:hypothetical protein